MTQELYVMLGDIVASRRIKDREKFREKLEQACEDINRTFAGDIYANFKILKGIDEIEGVLMNIVNVYKIMDIMLEKLYPHSMRFVTVFDKIDTALESREVSRMDGPAFHKASDALKDLKASRLIFRLSTGDEILDKIIAGETNLIFFIKNGWSPRQRTILREYIKTGTQDMVAKNLDITQQAVSKAIKRTMWKEISGIEEDLNHILQNHPKGLLGEKKKDKA